MAPDRSTLERVAVFSLAERPDLGPAIPDLLASRWPGYMLAGQPGHGADLNSLIRSAPQHQMLLLDTDERVLAVGLSLPLDWDGTTGGLPAGWDGAVARAAALADQAGTPDTVCALSITMSPLAGRRGLAPIMVTALKEAAADAGAAQMVAPVRPILKADHPLVPMAEYVDWRTPAGEVFDPWLRLHLRLGAHLLGIADPSMTITGAVADWRTWTGEPLASPGAHVIPGGLVPLMVDQAVRVGLYREPNVWVSHPC